MRRCLTGCALVGLLAVSGCSNFRSLFSAHRGVAAEAGGQQLTVQQLTHFLSTGKGAPVNRDVAEYVAQLWVDYALFAQDVAAGTLPTDSASVAKAAWSEIAQIRERRWHDTLVARRPAATSTQADSAYQANEVRVVQHILFRVPPGGKADDKTAARKKAEAAAAQLKRGADFGTLASKLSEDPGTGARAAVRTGGGTQAAGGGRRVRTGPGAGPGGLGAAALPGGPRAVRQGHGTGRGGGHGGHGECDGCDGCDGGRGGGPGEVNGRRAR